MGRERVGSGKKRSRRGSNWGVSYTQMPAGLAMSPLGFSFPAEQGQVHSATPPSFLIAHLGAGQMLLPPKPTHACGGAGVGVMVVV